MASDRHTVYDAVTEAATLRPSVCFSSGRRHRIAYDPGSAGGRAAEGESGSGNVRARSPF